MPRLVLNVKQHDSDALDAEQGFPLAWLHVLRSFADACIDHGRKSFSDFTSVSPGLLRFWVRWSSVAGVDVSSVPSWLGERREMFGESRRTPELMIQLGQTYKNRLVSRRAWPARQLWNAQEHSKERR